MKYLIKRKENYVAINYDIHSNNWSEYFIVKDKKRATIFDKKEEAQKAVDAIYKEHLDNISRLKSKEKIRFMNKMFEESFGKPYIVEEKDDE